MSPWEIEPGVCATERRGDHRPIPPEGVAVVTVQPFQEGKVLVTFIPMGMLDVMTIGRQYQWQWTARRGARRITRRMETIGYTVRIRACAASVAEF